MAPDARLFTCKSRLTQRARGSIYHWGSSAAVPAPWVCSGNSPHTRRFPWQPPEPSGAAISTNSSFFLFLAAPPPTHSSFRRPGEGFFSYKHFGLTERVRLSSKHQSWLQASPAALRGRWCSKHCTPHYTARRSACHGALAHTRPLGTQGTTTRHSFPSTREYFRVAPKVKNFVECRARSGRGNL